jgi:hypothetical protein
MATKKAMHDDKLPASGLVSLILIVPGYIKERLERQSAETGQSIDQIASFFLDEVRVEELTKLIVRRELDSRYGHYLKFLEDQAASAERMLHGVERFMRTVGIFVQRPKRKNSN